MYRKIFAHYTSVLTYKFIYLLAVLPSKYIFKVLILCVLLPAESLLKSLCSPIQLYMYMNSRMVESVTTKFCKGLLYEKRSICVNYYLDPINVRITYAAFCTHVHSHRIISVP